MKIHMIIIIIMYSLLNPKICVSRQNLAIFATSIRRPEVSDSGPTTFIFHSYGNF